MQVPCGTNLASAAVVTRLLEDEALNFYTVLNSSDGSLSLYGGGQAMDTPQGQLEIWWGVEISARTWGIKNISPRINKLVLDGYYVDLDDSDTGEKFHYEYPENAQAPKWKVETRVERFSSDKTALFPSAKVNLNKRVIEILF